MKWYLEAKVDKNNSEKRKELLEGIAQARELIDDILEFSHYKDESFIN
jgi:hypothetical protein